MKKLSKDQQKFRDDLVKRLDDALIGVNNAVEKANAAIDEYNVIVADVESYRDEIVSEMETYFDERSDKWQEGDAGSAYSEWKGEWENLDCSAIDQVDEPDSSLMGELEALPMEVET